MPTHDYAIANAPGATVRADLNAALAAIVGNNSDVAAPATTFAYMWWADTTNGLLKQRDASNLAWITVGILGSTNLGLLALTGGSMSGALNEAAGTNIVAAATTNIAAATGNSVTVTHASGTIAITAFGTVAAGAKRDVRFSVSAGVLSITHNATSMRLPGGANITIADGDRAIVRSLGSGNWECLVYTKASGVSVVSSLSDYLEYRDEKASGTDGGTFSSGAWRTRTLNLEHADTGNHGTLASNEVTLDAGTYECLAFCPGHRVSAHQARLYNVTDASVIQEGTSSHADSAGVGNGAGMSHSVISARFTIASAKAVRLEHQCSNSVSNNGFGRSGDFGINEVFSVLKLWKVA